MTTKDFSDTGNSSCWAYLASIWAFLFALLSFFWAVGGRTGLHPFELEGANDPLLYATNLIAGFLKLGAAGVALALMYRWRNALLRWIVLIAASLASAIFLLHGLYSIAGDILVITKVVSVPEPTSWKWRMLDLFLWGPWWLIGGLLFSLASWFFWHVKVRKA